MSFDESFVTDCIRSCHFDHLQRSLWRKFRQNDEISISIYLLWLLLFLDHDSTNQNHIVTVNCRRYRPPMIIAHSRLQDLHVIHCMMTSSNGNIFRVTGPLWEDFAGHRWIPLIKASGAELWCFLWSTLEQAVEQTIETLVIWDAIELIMTSL